MCPSLLLRGLVRKLRKPVSAMGLKINEKIKVTVNWYVTNLTFSSQFWEKKQNNNNKTFGLFFPSELYKLTIIRKKSELQNVNSVINFQTKSQLYIYFFIAWQKQKKTEFVKCNISQKVYISQFWLIFSQFKHICSNSEFIYEFIYLFLFHGEKKNM